MNKNIKIWSGIVLIGIGVFMSGGDKAEAATATCLANHAGFCRQLGLQEGQSREVNFESAKAILEDFYNRHSATSGRGGLGYSYMEYEGGYWYWRCGNTQMIRFEGVEPPCYPFCDVEFNVTEECKEGDDHEMAIISLKGASGGSNYLYGLDCDANNPFSWSSTETSMDCDYTRGGFQYVRGQIRSGDREPYEWSEVFEEQIYLEECTQQPKCTGGNPPLGATWCPGDNIGLTSSIPWQEVSNCTNTRKCEYTMPSPSFSSCTGGNPPLGATWCPGDNTGLISSIPWQSVTTCTNSRKCEYYFKAKCGTANAKKYKSETELKNAGLCKSGFRPSVFTKKPTEFSDPGGSFGKWEWTCSKTGYVTSDTCSAEKYGQCNDTPANAPYNNLNGQNGACRFGHFNSVSVTNGIFKWTCGTNSFNTKHLGSFNNSSNFGNLVPADNYEPTSGGDSNCQCTAQYKSYCQLVVQADCSQHCNEQVEEQYQPYKKDVACFPKAPTSKKITREEYRNNNPRHIDGQPATCENKSVTCGPCGTTNGGSDTINETN